MLRQAMHQVDFTSSRQQRGGRYRAIGVAIAAIALCTATVIAAAPALPQLAPRAMIVAQAGAPRTGSGAWNLERADLERVGSEGSRAVCTLVMGILLAALLSLQPVWAGQRTWQGWRRITGNAGKTQKTIGSRPPASQLFAAACRAVRSRHTSKYGAAEVLADASSLLPTRSAWDSSYGSARVLQRLGTHITVIQVVLASPADGQPVCSCYSSAPLESTCLDLAQSSQPNSVALDMLLFIPHFCFSYAGGGHCNAF